MTTGELVREPDEDLVPAIDPFPGLRPFREDETHLYFGREKHRGEILKRMSSTRFMAVVGTSGSGKSSLVRAGLLPDLCCGYLPGTGSDWIVIEIAPGHDPIGRLAAKFTEAGWPVDASELRTNSTQILDLAGRHLQPGQHLLVLVDQLEELFRLKTSDDPLADSDEKAAFIRLLLNAGGQRAKSPSPGDPRVHVVIAMRSEFLGRASAYRGLPEAIDQGQYLIPRLSREQLRRAIESPVRVADGEIEEALVQRLLNELGDDQDQLPVLQHALMRTWQCWTRRGRTGKLDDQAYVECGGFEKALSLDATDALEDTTRTMGDRGARIVQRVFQALRETDVSGGQTRRPTKVADLLEIAECSREELTAALAPFRRRSFIFPSPDTPLEDSIVIDVSHEALLRRWHTLREWIEEDDRDRRLYLRIAYRAADERNAEHPDFFAPPLLPVLVKFWADRRPTRAWATRHHPEYELAREFLDKSERHQQELDRADEARTRELAEAKLKRARTKERAYVGGAFALLILLVGGLVLQRQVEEGKALGAQLIATKAAALAEGNLETRIQLAAESVKRVPTLDAQQLLLESIFAAARPTREIVTSAETPPRPAKAVAISPSGDVLYVLTADGHLKAFDVASGQARFSVALADLEMTDDALPMATGRNLILVSDSVSIVDGATGRQIGKPAIDPVHAFAASANGSKAAFVSNGIVHVCDLSDQCAKPAELPFDKDLGSFRAEDLAFSPDGRKMVVLGDSSTNPDTRLLVLFETTPWKQVGSETSDDLDGVIGLGLDQTSVYVCSEETVSRYDAYDNSVDMAGTTPFPSHATGCSFSGERIATGHEDGTTRVWEGGRNQIAMVSARVAGWRNLAVGGTVLVTSGDRVRAWDLQHFGWQADAPRGGIFVQAASHIFGDGRLYDLDARKRGGEFLSGGWGAIAVSDSLQHVVATPPAGTTAAVRMVFAEIGAGRPPRILWEVPAVAESPVRASRASRSSRVEGPQAIAISPDDRYVAVRGSSAAQILDAKTGWVVRQLKDWPKVWFTSTPNEVLALAPNAASVWPLPTGEPRLLPADASLGGDKVGALAFSGDGRLLAVAESASTDEPEGTSKRTWMVRLYAWPSVNRLAEFQHPAPVTSLAFRRDARALLAVTGTSTIHVWDLDARQESVRIPAPSRTQTHLTAAFTPAGMIAINDASGLTILPADPARWIDEACARIVRNLTRDEWSVFLGPRVAYAATCKDRP